MRSRRECSSIWRNNLADGKSPDQRRKPVWGKALKRYSRAAFLFPSLLGVSAFVLVPFADVVRRSFVTALSEKFCGLDNYVTVFRNQAFVLAVRNTVRFELVCLPVLLAGSLLIAFAMLENPWLERFKALYLLPMAMPAATVVLVWRLVFAKQGFLSSLLGVQYEFMDGGRAFWVLIFTYLWKNLGYTIVLWLAALKAVPPEIREAARVDGAGVMREFLYIILPCLRGASYTISLLSFLNTFRIFREAYLIGGAYPSEDIYMIQHVFHNWYTRLDLDKLAAGAVLTAAVLGTFALFAGRKDM